jgi:hypothetical protein
MVLITILEMVNVRYYVIMNVLVLRFKRKIFICYHFMKNVNFVCDANENVSSSVNTNRKRKKTQDASSKLGHCRLVSYFEGENRETT